MYCKLFSSITESSLMEEPMEVRYVFLMLLAVADWHGYVRGSDDALARRFNIPLTVLTTSVDRLLQPDSRSNSPQQEGRRLVRPDTGVGYQIVNYETYRNMRDDNHRRKYLREYQQRRRAASKQAVNSCKQLSTSLTHTDTDTDIRSTSNKGGRESCAVEPPPGFPKTEDEAKASAETTGVPPEFASSYYNLTVGRGYCDSKGVAIRSWPHAVKAAHEISASWQAERDKKAAAKPPNSRPLTVLDLKTIRDTKVTRATELLRHRSETAFGHTWTDDEKRKEYVHVRMEIKELNKRIEGMA